MKRFLFAGVIVLLIAVGIFLSWYLSPEAATFVLTNGIVYTVNDDNAVAEAIAIDGDRIVGVGNTKEILASFRPDSVIDLQGRAVFPGFIDAHAHIEGLGLALATINLVGSQSIEEVQNLVRAEMGSRNDTAWIRGRGWDQNRWENTMFPHHAALDVVSRDVPIYLVRIDGHAAWVNEKVLRLAGITNATTNPEGGKIIRDARGNPTGVFVDNAMDLVRRVMPPITPAERRYIIQRALTECVRLGLTEVHDMGVDLEQIALYRELHSQGGLPLRIYGVIDGVGETWEHYQKTGPEVDQRTGFLTVRALKLYADGALGSRGAALIYPYADDPGNRGLAMLTADSLEHLTASAVSAGFQVCVHAIGDRANNIVLGAFGKVLTAMAKPSSDFRLRVEHAQILDSADVPRFARMQVIPSMQPTHCTSDMYWVDERLGSDRSRYAYAWRSLLEQGSILPAGSDFPVEAPNPLWGFYAAVTRQDQNGWPPDGWHRWERMSREEALKAYTRWGAHAAFQEQTKGVIAPGYWADLVVLSNDIMKTEPQNIVTTEAVMTMVGGRIVYPFKSR